MTDYTTEQLYSLALLGIFILLFLYKVALILRRLRSKSLLTKNRTLKKLKRLSWEEFEVLSMEYFALKGWKVKGNEKKGADGGVDIWMYKNRWYQKKITAIVQCKRYDDALVGIKVIREMYGLMHEYGVDEVYVITTSRFTKECYLFSKEKNINLIDGLTLLKTS